MSKITDVYNQLIIKTTDLFSDKNRLHNPYTLGENPELIRKKGWGLRVNPANNEIQEFCNMTLSRQFQLVLTRQFVSLAGKEDGFDSVTLELLEAQQDFCSMIYATDELEIFDKIDRIDILDISGIESEVDGEKKYLNCFVSFNIVISESL